jgi:hypothetical protein
MIAHQDLYIKQDEFGDHIIDRISIETSIGQHRYDSRATRHNILRKKIMIAEELLVDTHDDQ